MPPTIESIEKTEIDESFIKGMRERMVMSYYKYGAVVEAYPHKVNAIASLMDRLNKYAETGNTEYLIDAANFAMIEFMYPSHPQAYFKTTDDDGSIGRIPSKRALPDKRNNKEIGKNSISTLVEFRDD